MTPAATITPGALGSILVACWGEYPHCAHGVLAADDHDHIVRVLMHATAAAPGSTACTATIERRRVDAALERARRPLRIAASFHTHLDGPAMPTRDDFDRLAASHDPMFIVSLEDLDEPDVRVWTLDEGRPSERALRLAPEPTRSRRPRRLLPGI